MHRPSSAQETHGLQIESRAEGDDISVIRLTGDADLHTAPMLRDVLEEGANSGVAILVIDLTGVTFIDSMMLGVLLGASRRTRAREIEMRIVVDDPHVRRIFELTLLDQVLTLCPSLPLALER